MAITRNATLYRLNLQSLLVEAPDFSPPEGCILLIWRFSAGLLVRCEKSRG